MAPWELAKEGFREERSKTRRQDGWLDPQGRGCHKVGAAEKVGLD